MRNVLCAVSRYQFASVVRRPSLTPSRHRIKPSIVPVTSFRAISTDNDRLDPLTGVCCDEGRSRTYSYRNVNLIFFITRKLLTPLGWLKLYGVKHYATNAAEMTRQWKQEQPPTRQSSHWIRIYRLAHHRFHFRNLVVRDQGAGNPFHSSKSTVYRCR